MIIIIKGAFVVLTFKYLILMPFKMGFAFYLNQPSKEYCLFELNCICQLVIDIGIWQLFPYCGIYNNMTCKVNSELKAAKVGTACHIHSWWDWQSADK